MPGILRSWKSLKIPTLAVKIPGKVPRPSFGLSVILTGLVLPLLIAACGGDGPTAAPQQAATSTPQPPPATATQPAPEPTSAPTPTSAPPMATETPVAPPPTAVATPAGPIPTSTPPSVVDPDVLMVTLGSSEDDTLYQSELSQRNNGAGQWLFAGKNGRRELRRGLIGFDIAAGVPAGATVTGVSLVLNMSRTLVSEAMVSLHRVTADWQEGKQQAFGNEGSGDQADAEAGDVTWNQRVFGSEDWEDEGGDFSPEASATAFISVIGPYTWGPTSRLVDDVQGWLDNPTSNFGWLLLGDESKSRTSKRFDTKDNEKEANRPLLVVEYRGG